jgi:hypothetical protein
VEKRTHGLEGSTRRVMESSSTKANLDLEDFGPEQLTGF